MITSYPVQKGMTDSMISEVIMLQDWLEVNKDTASNDEVKRRETMLQALMETIYQMN
jgi:hypothetical protein